MSWTRAALVAVSVSLAGTTLAWGARPLGLAPSVILEPAGGVQEPAAAGELWTERWDQLRSLREAEDSLLRYELCEDQRALKLQLDAGAPGLEAFRVELLGAALGQPSPEWGQVTLPAGLTQAERRLALEYLPPGEGRASALVGELLEADGQTPRDLPRDEILRLQKLGYEAFVEDHDRFEAGPARRLAEALHTSAQAVWSCFCVEGIARRTGDHARAQGVVQDQLQRAANPTERIELLQRLAIAAAGAGDRELELANLGRAMRIGGDDALQILGMGALFGEHRMRARRLFGAVLQRAQARGGETPPWALRGWGLSLLPGQGPNPGPAPR